MKQFELLILISLLTLAPGCALLSLGSDGDTDRTPAQSANDPNSIRDAQEKFNQRIHAAVENRDITLGMPMGTVRTAWGSPTGVDTAGDSKGGNERWTYSDSLNSRYGMGHSKVVYFERGRVVGWETH